MLFIHICYVEENPDFPVCLAPVLVADLPSGLVDAMMNVMRTMLVPNFACTCINIMNVNHAEVDVVHIEGLQDACARVSSLMTKEVQVRQLDPKEFKKELAAMDIQGLIIYCSPFALYTQSWINCISMSMIDLMWAKISKDTMTSDPAKKL